MNYGGMVKCIIVGGKANILWHGVVIKLVQIVRVEKPVMEVLNLWGHSRPKCYIIDLII